MVVHRRAAQPHGQAAFWQRQRQAGRCMRRTLKRASALPAAGAGSRSGAWGDEPRVDIVNVSCGGACCTGLIAPAASSGIEETSKRNTS